MINRPMPVFGIVCVEGQTAVAELWLICYATKCFSTHSNSDACGGEQIEIIGMACFNGPTSYVLTKTMQTNHMFVSFTWAIVLNHEFQIAHHWRNLNCYAPSGCMAPLL